MGIHRIIAPYRLLWGLPSKEERKHFFFEKKKQKTFSLAGSARGVLHRACAAPGTKVFWFFFSKKNTFLPCLFFPLSASAEPLSTLYTLHCSGCHGQTGHGVPAAGIPDLADSGAYLGSPAGRAYLVQVPGVAQSRLDDATAAAMLNYILARFSAGGMPKGAPPFTAGEVAKLRANVASDALAERRALLGAFRGQAYQR